MRRSQLGEKGKSTMSKAKKSKPMASSQLTLPGVPAQLAALQAGLGLSGAVFSRIERKQTLASSYHVPDALIELVATHAENNGGVVAGLPFDAAAARDALTQVSTAQAAVRAARQFAQRVEDDATLRRSDVADRAFGIFTALRRFVRTPEGKTLRDVYDEMHSTMRAYHKARKAKASAKANATVDTSAKADASTAANAEAPTTVVAEKPAAAPTSAPTAVAGNQPASTTSA
jgi:hypothetical protein